MSTTQTTPAQNFSRTLAAANEVLFPEAAAGSFNERFIVNPNAANTIWVNPFAGDAAANGVGSIPIVPNGSFTLRTCSEVRVFGAVGDKITAGQR